MTSLIEQVSRTVEMKSSTHRFNWRVDNFNELCSVGTKEFDQIESPIFTIDDDPNKITNWYVKMRGSGGTIKLFLQLQIQDGPPVLKDVRCAFKLGLGNSHDPFCAAKSAERTFAKKLENWGWFDFMDISHLHLDPEMYLEGGVLQVAVQIKVYSDPTLTSMTLTPPNEVTSVCTDLQNLFDSKELSDVTIKCGGVCFRAHKLILSARSQVFKAMFETGMKESVKGEIIIDDMEPSIVKLMLQFIYTGQFKSGASSSVMESDWLQLIYAAEKYNLIPLKNFSFCQLFDKITIESAGNLAVMALTYNAEPEMRETIRKFCKTNISKLMEISSFQKILLQNPAAFFDHVPDEDQVQINESISGQGVKRRGRPRKVDSKKNVSKKLKR